MHEDWTLTILEWGTSSKNLSIQILSHIHPTFFEGQGKKFETTTIRQLFVLWNWLNWSGSCGMNVSFQWTMNPAGATLSYCHTCNSFLQLQFNPSYIQRDFRIVGQPRLIMHYANRFVFIEIANLLSQKNIAGDRTFMLTRYNRYLFSSFIQHVEFYDMAFAKTLIQPTSVNLNIQGTKKYVRNSECSNHRKLSEKQ